MHKPSLRPWAQRKGESCLGAHRMALLQLAAVWLLCWVIIICMRVITAGENSTKAVSRRAPSAAHWVQPWRLPGCLQSLPAGSLPSCRQRGHSHSSNQRQRSTGTGGAPCVWLSRDASCPEETAARYFPALQGGCQGSLAPQLELGGGLLCPETARGTGHPLPLSGGKKEGTALLSCWDWGHLHAGNLPSAAGLTHSSHAPLPGAGTRCSCRAPKQRDLPSRAERQRDTLLRGAQQALQDARSQLDCDCAPREKSFPYGVQPRDPGTAPGTPGHVAGALISREMRAQGTGRAG